jgi:hypothetical protein
MKKIFILFFSLSSFVSIAQNLPVTFKNTKTSVDVLVGGKPFTSYFFPGQDVLKKAVLFPLISAQGTTITRGYPMAPRAGERIDHPHHVGMWLNYEDVNGFDYWNNSTNIIASLQNHKMGTIVHTSVVKQDAKKGLLEVSADWIDNDGKGQKVLQEKTTYVFSGTADSRTVDRITTLTAMADQVLFKDVKDGMFAIRVARQLEIPSNKPDVFTDAHGIETKGEAVWSTRAKWMNLHGVMDNHPISVTIFDHPANVSYPSYWHARGYGLFAVNPLGAKVFSNGKDERNFTLKKGESVTFRYRTLISDRLNSKEELDKIQAEFASVK